jgi:glycosyltransferase involved in cell wall biosynthesis
MLYADPRRIGDHGIGRFARCVLAGLEYSPVPLRTDPDSPLDPWRLTRALGKLSRNDLFFSPGYNPPLKCPAPFVFPVHDLNHLDRPENSSPLKRLYYALVVKRACHQAARVFTVSEFSRERIIEWSGVSPEKVVNVRCGVGPEYHPEVAPYEMPFPYILCVSNRRRHKNEFRQLEAFAKSGLPDEIQFVLTGDPNEEITDFIKRNQIAKRVHFLGLIPDAQLPSLYRSARALTFVSLYEGFGLPVLEALACGTPVVTSNTSALPELAGDAALLVDPTSVDEISEAMTRIVSDTPLRVQLRERGLAQAARFSWAGTVAKVQQLLNSDAIRGAGEGR